MVKIRQTPDSLRQALTAAGLFSVLVLGLWLAGKVFGLNTFYERLEAGVVRAGTAVGNGVSRVVQSENSLSSKYAACQADARSLAALAVHDDSLEQEVTELRGLMAYTGRTGASGMVTHVIARAVDDDATRVLIDKGEEDGVVVGSAAVIDDGVLFGVVEDVREATSVVRLTANANSNLPAAVLGTERTIGLVKGQDGALLSMDFIPQDAELAKGDLVVTSGLDGQVKEGLVIGLVTDVVSVESAPFKQAFIELLYEPREWTTLLILPPPGV